MNKNNRVVSLVVSCFFVYLFVSTIMVAFDVRSEIFDKVNLISEIVKRDNKKEGLTKEEIYKKVEEKILEEDFDQYNRPEYITNFYKGDTIVALPRLAQKLYQLETSQKGKIRIAYLGDSTIEGDLITQTIRKLLQQKFGGDGVGYLPLFSNVAKYRQTASISSSGFKDNHFKDKTAKNLYLSGHYFMGTGQGTYKDNTINHKETVSEKSIIFGKTDNLEIIVNGTLKRLQGNNLVNRIILDKGISNSVSIKSNSNNVPIYGISFESENGIFLDNFSFRGITGVELNKIDEEFFLSIQENNPYDLIVLQYGVNLLYRPKDTDFSYYETLITPVFKKLKKTFGDAEILLVSSGDMAFRYDGVYRSAIGLPNLIELQAKMAKDNGFTFYNQFQSMGGENSIVDWVNANPALAYKDYTHFTPKGAELVAHKLYNAILRDYENYKLIKK